MSNEQNSCILKQIFPDIDNEVIELILQATHNDLQVALETLLNISDPTSNDTRIMKDEKLSIRIKEAGHAAKRKMLDLYHQLRHKDDLVHEQIKADEEFARQLVASDQQEIKKPSRANPPSMPPPKKTKSPIVIIAPRSPLELYSEDEIISFK